MANKFLNQQGVGILWDKINAKFAEKSEITRLEEQISALQPDDGSGNAELVARIQAAEQAIKEAEEAINVLNAEEGEGSVAQVATAAAAAEITKVVANADADFDTLKEIADWILNDTIGATQMANDISALKEYVGNESVATQIAAKIDEALKVDGVNKYALASELKTLADRIDTLESAGYQTAANVVSIINEQVTSLSEEDIDAAIALAEG